MTGSDHTFREEAHRLRVEPSTSAWKRIEAQMETQRMRHKAKISRRLNYAAAAILLVGVSLATLYYLEQPQLTERSAYTVTILDLDSDVTTNQSIYDVEKARTLSAVMLAYH